MKSASAEVIPELSLELYEALLALDNGCCQAFLSIKAILKLYEALLALDNE